MAPVVVGQVDGQQRGLDARQHRRRSSLPADSVSTSSKTEATRAELGRAATFLPILSASLPIESTMSQGIIQLLLDVAVGWLAIGTSAVVVTGKHRVLFLGDACRALVVAAQRARRSDLGLLRDLERVVGVESRPVSLTHPRSTPSP